MGDPIFILAIGFALLVIIIDFLIGDDPNINED